MWETSESFGVKPLQRWHPKRNRSHKTIAHWLEYVILTKITTNAMSREEPRDYSQQHLEKCAWTEICANSMHKTGNLRKKCAHMTICAKSVNITFSETQQRPTEVKWRDEKKIRSATSNLTLQAWQNMGNRSAFNCGCCSSRASNEHYC